MNTENNSQQNKKFDKRLLVNAGKSLGLIVVAGVITGAIGHGVNNMIDMEDVSPIVWAAPAAVVGAIVSCLAVVNGFRPRAMINDGAGMFDFFVSNNVKSAANAVAHPFKKGMDYIRSDKSR